MKIMHRKMMAVPVVMAGVIEVREVTIRQSMTKALAKAARTTGAAGHCVDLRQGHGQENSCGDC
jgi:hypothetical protein